MSTNEQVRIRPNDVLYVWHKDLCRRGLTVKIADADQRDQWFSECRELLALVPNDAQRFSWQLYMSLALVSGTPGLSVKVVMGCLSNNHP